MVEIEENQGVKSGRVGKIGLQGNSSEGFMRKFVQVCWWRRLASPKRDGSCIHNELLKRSMFVQGIKIKRGMILPN